MTISRKIAALLAGAAFAAAASAPVAIAGPPDPDPKTAKCNSGRGNDSETTPANDCDPGNSAGHNQGGD